MPLTWDVSNIRDHEHVTTNPGTHQWHPITMAIVTYTMPVGIPIIKDERVARIFYARLQLVHLARHLKEARDGWPEVQDIGTYTPPPAPKPRRGRPPATPQPVEPSMVWRALSLSDIIAHIGLRTNASPMTQAEFLANLKRVHQFDLEWNWEIEDLEEDDHEG